MSVTVQKVFALVLCLALCLGFAPAAFAEESGELITGFAGLGEYAVVETPFQYAWVELEKRFPGQITAYFGETARDIDVSWTCVENYSDRLDEYHVVPVLDGCRLAPGLELPVITVVVLGDWEIPPLTMTPSSDTYVPSILGALTPNGTLSENALPSKYNAYEKGLLPPIRNQNPYGTCWAHATIGAIETDLIRDGAANTGIDLSELHLVYYYTHDYHDEKGCNTGDTITLYDTNYLSNGSIDEAANLLANMVGPATEASVPYSLNYAYNPGGADGRALNAAQVTGVYKYNIDDRAGIKNAILTHGSVTTTYYDDSYCYDAYYNSYYSTTSSLNHAVLLVGWDDSFPRNNFPGSTKPEGDGAWLVRNSWGFDGYARTGYFWLSYYDKSLHFEGKAIAFDAQSWTYDHCYAYDGGMPEFYYTFDFNASAVESFRVDGGEKICAVGITSYNENATFTVTLSCGGRSVTGSVQTTCPGFYMIELPKPLRVESDSTVLVTLSHNVGSSFKLVCEAPSSKTYTYSGEVVKVTSSSCGSGGVSYGGFRLSYDARIKLYTMDDDAGPDLILPASVTTIGEEAFMGGAFSYVKLSEKTVSIGKNAFAKCPNLAYIYIPAATTTIDLQAFGANQGLTICGKAGSYAETYANALGFAFKAVS